MTQGSTLAMLLAILLCTSLVFCSGEDPNVAEISSRIATINSNVNEIQFKTSEVLYQQIREAIGSRYFPIESFPTSLSRQSKNAEQAAAKISQRSQSLKDEWTRKNSGSTLLEDLKQSRLMFARVELDELKGALDRLLEQRASFIEARDTMTATLTTGYSPKGLIEMYLDVYGLAIQIATYLLCFSIPLIAFLPIKRRGHLSLYVILGVATVTLLCGGGYVMIKKLHMQWGVPEPVQQVRDHVKTLPLYWNAFEHSLSRINESISWLDEYVIMMDVFNETVINGIVQFSKKVSEVASVDTTDPEMALQIVVRTRERLEQQKSALNRLQASRSMRSNKQTELNNLLNFLNYFEMFFSQMETNIYSNLKAGYDMNQFFVENMDIMLHHIKEGNLVSCISILNELYSQQLAQLSNLKKANQFVRKTNDAISQVRSESTRLQPALESEELELWVKKMASKGSMAFAALPAVAMFSIPLTAMVPVAALGAGIAAIGYNFQGAYNQAEKETREIIMELGKLDDVLKQTEEGLSNHEKVLSMLMDEVGDVIRNVNQSQARFQYIQVRRAFSPREIEFLNTGVSNTKSSVKTLTKRYQDAMTTLFNRILSRSVPQLPSTPGSPAVAPLQLPLDTIEAEGQGTNSVLPEGA